MNIPASRCSIRSKSALNASLVLVVAAYPMTMAFTLAVRTGKMSVISGRPPALAPPSHGSPPAPPSPTGPDLWKEDDLYSLLVTVMSFASVIVVHLIILCCILMKRAFGAPEMRKKYAAAVPVMMFFITETYFLSYLSLSRYGVTTGEWIILTLTSCFLAVLTIVLYVVPAQEDDVVGYVGQVA